METDEIEDSKCSLWQNLYSKGDDIQKLSVIQAIPSLLETDHNGTVTRILPKIQQELPINSSSEFQLVTSKMFKILIEMKLDMNLMRPVLQGIDSKDPVVANAWSKTLLEVIHCLSEETLKTDVLPLAVKLSQLNKTTFYRKISCKILGQVAIHPKITAFDVKKDIVPLTQSLCQDCMHEVRTVMCSELPNIAKGLADEVNVEVCLLPCLVELSSDENMQVRAAAVDAAVLLILCLSADTIKSTAIPLVKRLCVQCDNEGDLTFPTVAKIYGKLLGNLQTYLTDVDCLWFLNNFKELSRRGLSTLEDDADDPVMAVTCRDYCALNLPAVTHFVITYVKQEMNKWYNIFRDLAADPCYIVRKTVASYVHIITKILGADTKLIFTDLLKLIRDDSEEVLDALVPNIGSILVVLTTAGMLSRETANQVTLDIGRALLKCQVEVYKNHNWRRRKAFLEQLEDLPTCMPPDFIQQHFTPLVMKLMLESRARPVRTQAARTILVFLRYNVKENQRKWIRENLINLLCNSDSCYTRHIFINMCYDAIQIFSCDYFKAHFFTPLLSLGDDPVTTVRISLVQICPILKNMLVLPADRNLQNLLEEFVSKIETLEKDQDVIATLKQKLKEMRVPPVVKHEDIIEEKRKLEEEELIMQGKSLPNSLSKSLQGASLTSTTRVSKDTVTPRRVGSFQTQSSSVIPRSPPITPNTNEMSFLDQHFYIDAGVALPETASNSPIHTLDENMSLLSVNSSQNQEEEISTVSVENTNIENMSDEDLLELKTSTTNITDDVKVNIEKKASRMSTECVKKRNKRNSCFFSSDVPKNNNGATLRRRSLNIGSGEISRIPVITKNGSEKCRAKMKVEKPSKLKKPTIIKTDDSNKLNDNNANVYNTEIDNKLVYKEENVPINSSIKEKIVGRQNNGAKVSNLPVLIKRFANNQK